MGLFDKKVCFICGGPIGFLGNKKLADGDMCKDCENKISPFITDRKHWSVDEIREHLAYRDANMEALRGFQTATVVGSEYKLYVDAIHMQWFVTRSNDYLRANPDIFAFSQITGCDVSIDESRHEVYYHAPDGRHVSYNPPEYDYDYNFYVTVYTNSFVPQIKMKLNTFTIHDDLTREFKQCEAEAYAMKSLFDQMASCVPQLNIPAQFVMDSVYIADLDRQRSLRDRDRELRRRTAPGSHIGAQVDAHAHLHEAHHDIHSAVGVAHGVSHNTVHTASVNHNVHSTVAHSNVHSTATHNTIHHEPPKTAPSAPVQHKVAPSAPVQHKTAPSAPVQHKTAPSAPTPRANLSGGHSASSSHSGGPTPHANLGGNRPGGLGRR